MLHEDAAWNAREIAQAIWLIFFFSFLTLSFYVHAFVAPFKHTELFDPKSKNYKFNLRIMLVFFILLVSGLILFD